MVKLEQIDQYLDHQLPEEEVREFEKNLQRDADLQRLLNSVYLVRESVQAKALSDRIRRIHNQHLEEEQVESLRLPGRVVPMPVRQPFNWALRIAASLLLGVTAYNTYELATLNSSRYYESKFMPYQLPITRSRAENVSKLDSLYASGSYEATVEQFSKLTAKHPRDYFLTGMAQLQSRNFDQAITLFTTLRENNSQPAAQYFVQETDYYLALAYVGINRIDEAQTLFKSIRNNPRHNYYRTVTDGDLLKLNLLRVKQ